jgi:hypothetical protein
LVPSASIPTTSMPIAVKRHERLMTPSPQPSTRTVPSDANRAGSAAQAIHIALPDFATEVPLNPPSPE